MTDFEDLHGMSVGEYENMIRDEAIADYQRRVAAEFAEYVIGEAETTIYEPEFNKHAINEAIRELEHAGFRVVAADEPNVFVFAHPECYYTLQEEARGWTVIEDSSELDQFINYYGMTIHLEPNVPTGTAVAVHLDAVAPNPIHDVSKPWIVRNPAGIVEILTPGDADD